MIKSWGVATGAVAAATADPIRALGGLMVGWLGMVGWLVGWVVGWV